MLVGHILDMSTKVLHLMDQEALIQMTAIALLAINGVLEIDQQQVKVYPLNIPTQPKELIQLN